MSKRMRAALGTIAAMLALLALGACGSAGTSTVAGAEAGAEGGDDTRPTGDDANGAPADEILQGTFETIDGETIMLESLAGQDVVFWFWAPW